MRRRRSLWLQSTPWKDSSERKLEREKETEEKMNELEEAIPRDDIFAMGKIPSERETKTDERTQRKLEEGKVQLRLWRDFEDERMREMRRIAENAKFFKFWRKMRRKETRE